MANWKHCTTREKFTGKDLPEKFKKFLEEQKPGKDGLVAMLSHGKDFHIWARNDNSPLKWKLKVIGPWDNQYGPKNIETLLNSGNIVTVGFNIMSPPSIWYFECNE